MVAIRVDEGEWVIVCDGRKALIVENAGDRHFPSLRTKEVLEHQNAPTHDQGSDAPGRAYAPVGALRSSVRQTDWHDQAERLFLEKVAARLDAAVTARQAGGFHVVAPPRALGMLRNAYSSAVRSAVRTELDKDLVKLPLHEIERQLLRE